MKQSISIIFIILSAVGYSQEAKYINGQLYVKTIDSFSADLSDRNFSNKQLDEIVLKYGVSGIERPFTSLGEKLSKTYQFKFPDNSIKLEFIEALEALNFIEYAEQVPKCEFFYTPNDLNINQWNLQTIQAEQAWDISLGNSSIKIGLVDDAVLLSHQDLQPVVWSNPGEIAGNGIDDDGNGYIDDVNGWDAADNDNDPNPLSPTNSYFTHGTHCAGIAAASTDNNIGIASISSNVTLVPVKIGTDFGSSLTGALAGVQYAIVAEVDVISMSWGGYGYSATYQNVFDYAYSQGITCVAAAGNSTTNAQMYPAAYNHVISVGSTQLGDGVSYFSNYGSTIDVMAPGSGIWSSLAGSNSSYGFLSGTSMACPLVSGLAALMLSKNPNLTPDELEICLENSCDNIDAQNPTYFGQIGAGRINAFKAIGCVKAINADFLSDYQFACANGTVQFSDLSSNFPSSWEWSFPGGNPASSTSQNPAIQYSSTGFYDVTLIVTNTDGSDTITRVNYVEVGVPSATISGNYTISQGAAANLSVIFTGSAPWGFTYSDGSVSTVVSGITNSPYLLNVAPVISTNYSLIAMNDQGCSGTFSGLGTVSVAVPIVGNDSLCLDILNVQKISDTQGGFQGILPAQCRISSVASIGDINGDGVSDLAMGAYWDSDGGTQKGAVWVLFMNPNGTVLSEQKISATQGGFGGNLVGQSKLGRTLIGLGDFDGDGIGDILAGASGDEDGGTSTGAAFIILLNSDGTVKGEQKISDSEGGFTGNLDAVDNFGTGVALLGDMNGDGILDIAVSSTRDDDGGVDRGAVYILFMNANGTVGSFQKISDTQGGFTGVLDNGGFWGGGVTGLGDVDGDGVTDIVVGARFDDDGGTASGASWILFLNSNGTVKGHQKIGALSAGFVGALSAGDGFGFSNGNVGDIDGDGIDELIVGSWSDDDGGTNRGAAYIFFLNNDGTIRYYFKISDLTSGFSGNLSNSDNLGTSVNGIGDFDGNGVPDFVMAAFKDDDGGTDKGAVYIVSLIDTCSAVVELPCDTIPMSDSLVACYSMDGNTDDNINSLDGTLFGGVTLTTDSFGNANSAYHFDGVNGSWIELPDTALIKAPQVSMSVWLSTEMSTSQYVVFTRNNNVSTNYMGLGIAISNGKFRAYKKTAGSTDADNAESTTNIQVNKWYHVVATFDGDSVKIYVDGVLEDYNTLSFPIDYQVGKDVYIGGSNEPSAWPYLGNMDNVRFYNRVISNTEVLQLYDGFVQCSDSCGTIEVPSVCGIVPDFSATAVCIGDSTHFTDLSTDSIANVVGWNWDFDDGTSLVGNQNPAHLYANADTFLVELVVTNDDSSGVCFGAITKSVIVVDTLTIVMNDEDTICFGDSVSIGPNQLLCSQFPYSYQWSPLLGMGNSNSSNPNVSPATTTTYYVTVTDNQGAVDIDSIFIFVNQSCCQSIALVGLDSTYCIGDTVYFVNNSSGASNASYEWDFGPLANPSTFTGATPPGVVFGSTGAVSVSLILSDTCSNDTAFAIVNIFGLPVSSLVSPVQVCAGDTVQLGVVPVSGFDYGWLPSYNLSDSTIGNPVGIIDSALTYIITITDNSSACSAVDSVIVMPVTGDNLVQLPNDTILCDGTGLILDVSFPNSSYFWQDGSTDSVFNIVTTGTYYVTVTAPCGVDIDSINVVVQGYPTVYLGEDTILCSDSILLTAAFQNVIYLWSTGVNDSSILVSSVGTYWLEVNLNGCISSDTIAILDGPIPLIDIGSDTLIVCGDSSSQLNISGSYDFLWSTGETGSSIEVDFSGWYTVEASNSCKMSSDSIYAAFQDYPDTLTYAVVEICEDQMVLLSAENEMGSYIWSSGEVTQEIIVYSEGPYQVTITNLGCELVEEIDVELCEIELFVPNLITPNGDDRNDTWIIDNLWYYPAHSIKIFNRNGNLVFEATDYKSDWDGTFKGRPLPATSYYYVLDIPELDRVYKGAVSIIYDR